MVVDAWLATQLLAGGLTVIMAGWLVWLRFSSPLTRAFALFLFVRGANILLNQFGRLTEDAQWRELWTDVSGYMVLAVLPALANFLVVYAMPQRTTRRTVMRSTILGAVVAILLVQLIDPCLVLCFRPGALVTIGPLAALSFGQSLAYAGAGWWLAARRTRLHPGPERTALLWVSLALASNGLFEATLAMAPVAIDGLDSLWTVTEETTAAYVGIGVQYAAAVPALIALTLLARSERASEQGRTALVAGLGMAAVGTAIVADLIARTGSGTRDAFFLVLGAWRMVMPVMISYALVRHRLFGIEVRMRASFSGGTVAAAVLATFFLTTELAQVVFAGWSGSVYIGIVFAAMLAFVIAPLEQLGHRIAGQVVPETRAAGPLTDDERIDYFRSQVEVAWSTGTLHHVDRLHLDALRTRLGLSIEHASRIEHEVTRRSSGGTDDGP